MFAHYDRLTRRAQYFGRLEAGATAKIVSIGGWSVTSQTKT
jgi:hypothetical protein